MSEEFVGQREAFLNGCRKGERDTKELMLEAIDRLPTLNVKDEIVKYCTERNLTGKLTEPLMEVIENVIDGVLSVICGPLRQILESDESMPE